MTFHPRHNATKTQHTKTLSSQRIFLWFMLTMLIIVLFFQENGLTLMEVMILQSVYSLTIAITEIPSGYIADFLEGKIHLF